MIENYFDSYSELAELHKENMANLTSIGWHKCAATQRSLDLILHSVVNYTRIEENMNRGNPDPAETVEVDGLFFKERMEDSEVEFLIDIGSTRGDAIFYQTLYNKVRFSLKSYIMKQINKIFKVGACNGR